MDGAWVRASECARLRADPTAAERPSTPPHPPPRVPCLPSTLKVRGFRFSLLSGDVHVAGVGRIQTYPKMNLKTDPK